MSEDTIRFDDGAAYEAMMGRWSLLVGAKFLDWLGPLAPRARWLDVGCGNGAFTELIVQRCAPADVQAVDPSAAQLAYARGRLPAGSPVTWTLGDAMRLPVGDAAVDVAVMALVLFFVPEPAVGVAEMCRAVRPGGLAAAYHWDILGGGLPLEAIHAGMRELGLAPLLPPSAAAADLEASAALWRGAGLQHVQTCRIEVQRRFEGFDDYWQTAVRSSQMRSVLDRLPPGRIAELEVKVRQRCEAVDGSGDWVIDARAHAVSGSKP